MLQVDEPKWKGYSSLYNFSKVLQVQTVAAESVLLDVWSTCAERPSRRFVLLGLAIYAVKTQNMIAVLAVLAFNVSLVIGGLLEAAQRNWSFALDVALYQQQEADPASISRARTIDIVLWIIPAVDLAFHLGCDWAAFKVGSASLRMKSCSVD